jgi:thiamine biosynthesis lipoprotein
MSTAAPARHHVVRTHAAMGTMASVHVHDDVAVDVVDAAVEAMWAELDRLEAMFSTFRPDSEISRINAGLLHPLDASPDVIEVLDACTWLEHVSNGAFTARRPSDGSLDPAGFVKGWASELAARHLDRAGLRQWYESVGGDIQTRGAPVGGGAWRVGIADPNSDDVHTLRAIVEVSDDMAVATSGLAARGRHLWDGRSGAAADRLASMTVVGPNLTWADAFATAAFALGPEGVEWVTRFDGYRALAITADGRLLRNAEQWRQPSTA